MKRMIIERKTERFYIEEDTPQSLPSQRPDLPPKRPDRREWIKIVGGWFFSVVIALIDLFKKGPT
jgi:hypothetical protein